MSKSQPPIALYVGANGLPNPFRGCLIHKDVATKEVVDAATKLSIAANCNIFGVDERDMFMTEFLPVNNYVSLQRLFRNAALANPRNVVNGDVVPWMNKLVIDTYESIGVKFTLASGAALKDINGVGWDGKKIVGVARSTYITEMKRLIGDTKRPGSAPNVTTDERWVLASLIFGLPPAYATLEIMTMGDGGLGEILVKHFSRNGWYWDNSSFDITSSALEKHTDCRSLLNIIVSAYSALKYKLETSGQPFEIASMSSICGSLGFSPLYTVCALEALYPNHRGTFKQTNGGRITDNKRRSDGDLAMSLLMENTSFDKF